MKIAGLAFLLLFGTVVSSGCFSRGSATGANQQMAKSGYAPVNGLQMYYEIHGTAKSGRPPLVLLHGGGDTIKTLSAASCRSLHVTGKSSLSSSRATDTRRTSPIGHLASNSRQTTQLRC